MTPETLKALLMTALLGVLEAAIYIDRIHALERRANRGLTRFWIAITTPKFALQKVRARRRSA
jgi:hypothetical protein